MEGTGSASSRLLRWHAKRTGDEVHAARSEELEEGEAEEVQPPFELHPIN
jgi:hypothetical protein